MPHVQSPELAEEFDHPVTIKQALRTEKQQAPPVEPASPKVPLPMNRRARKPRNPVSYSEEPEQQNIRCMRPRREPQGMTGGYSCKLFAISETVIDCNGLLAMYVPSVESLNF